MLEAIEKLLVLQDRDRRLIRLRIEVADIDPQRRLVQARQTAAEQEFERARHAGHQLESDRKKLELEVESKKELISKYAAQQWQTRKNEEYKALSHEIETCKTAISGLDDQQIELMEKIEAAERQVAAAAEVLKKAKADSAVQLQQMAEAETRLVKQLAAAEEARAAAAAEIDPTLLGRYERLLKSKGDKVIVDVQRGVCGGCHMKLSRQNVIDCQADRDIVQCPNCARILYYLPGMDVTPVE
ncbi:MAG: zinc ribbon domain-containing protein [Limisphaerales bacterium]